MGNLVEKATIPFRGALNEEGVHQLFDYYVTQIPGAIINYTVEKIGRIAHRDRGDISMDEYPTRFTASIQSTDIPLLSCFEVLREPITESHKCHRGEIGLFFGIRFELIGYDSIDEVPEHDRQMLGLLKNKTDEFFSE